MYILGISGGSGSGKTSFLKALSSRFSKDELSIISQDDYYLPADRSKDNHLINFDVPEAVDMNALVAEVQLLKAGRTVTREEYTFNNSADTASLIQITPCPILIVEGLFIFHHRSVDELLDHRIFIDADHDVRFQRRLARDMKERGYDEASIRYKWEHQVEPGFKNYLAPYKNRAQLIIDNNDSFQNELDIVCEELKELLTQK